MGEEQQDKRDSRWWAELPGERLEDDEIALEPLAAVAVPDMVAAVPPGECGVWGPVPGPLDEAAATAFVEEYDRGRRLATKLAWTVRRADGGGFLGGAVLIMSGAAEAELAYWTAPFARGHGYATRALILAADWALGRLALDRVWLEIDPANAASRRVAERAAFTPARLTVQPATEPAASGRLHGSEVYERQRLTEPPGGYSLRPARADDLDGVFALMGRCELHDLGEIELDEDDQRAYWQAKSNFDLSLDTWLLTRAVTGSAHRRSVHERSAGSDCADTGLAAGGERIVGFCWSVDEQDHEVLFGQEFIDPQERGRGLETVLMDRLEERARDHAAAAERGTANLGLDCVSTHEYQAELYHARGYRKTREFLRLGLDLSEVPAPPEWPAGITVRTFRRGRDEAVVHAAIEEAFSDHFRFTPISLSEWEEYCFGNPRLDTALWMVAWSGDEVAGSCLNLVPGDGATGWVEELGVRRAWRRRGLGTALLLESFRRLRDYGCRRAMLGVDPDNITRALHIYERAGMTLRRRIEFYEKSVRSPLTCARIR